MKNKQPSTFTEKTIQTISSGEYMSPLQLEFFRGRLEDERRKLLENAHETLEQIQTIAVGSDPHATSLSIQLTG